jgi:hypothetical protein
MRKHGNIVADACETAFSRPGADGIDAGALLVISMLYASMYSVA